MSRVEEEAILVTEAVLGREAVGPIINLYSVAVNLYPIPYRFFLTFMLLA